MIGYIAAYAGGIATGVLLLWLNRRSVNAALAKEQKRHGAELERRNREIEKLKTDYSNLERCFDARDIRAKGRQEGIEQGKRMNAAEQFATAWEGTRQNVKMGKKTDAA